MTKGKFIVIEGIDGSGKSTQANLLNDFLTGKNIQTFNTREPGGTKIAEDIREILKKYKITDALIEFLLLSAARRDHVKMIKDKIDNGITVITDRFYFSSIVYQGYLKNLDLGFIDHITSMVCDALKPDLVILLDIDDPSILHNRIEKRSKTEPDSQYDRINRDSKQNIINYYRESVKKIDHIKIDAANSIENIQNQIIKNTQFLF